MRRLIALVVGLLLLLPAGTASASLFFCSMTGRTVSKCCCGPGAKAEPAREQHQQLEQDDCCQERTHAASAERNGVATQGATPDVAPAPVLAIVPAEIWVARMAGTLVRAPARARAPPAPPAPLFIVHRAFLS